MYHPDYRVRREQRQHDREMRQMSGNNHALVEENTSLRTALAEAKADYLELAHAVGCGNDDDPLEKAARLVKAVEVSADTWADYEVKLAEYKRRCEAMAGALGMDTAYPVTDVILKLCEAADILLDKKSYDGHGHESIGLARAAGRKYVLAIWAALKLAALTATPPACQCAALREALEAAQKKLSSVPLKGYTVAGEAFEIIDAALTRKEATEPIDTTLNHKEDKR